METSNAEEDYIPPQSRRGILRRRRSESNAHLFRPGLRPRHRYRGSAAGAGMVAGCASAGPRPGSTAAQPEASACGNPKSGRRPAQSFFRQIPAAPWRSPAPLTGAGAVPCQIDRRPPRQKKRRPARRTGRRPNGGRVDYSTREIISPAQSCRGPTRAVSGAHTTSATSADQTGRR
jgi:hypothetical protein